MSNQLYFKAPDKVVILRAVTFSSFFRAPAFPTSCLQAPKQSRHPERSASQIDRAAKGFGRGVEEPVLSVAEGTSAVLNLPMLLGAFQPLDPGTVFPRSREPGNWLASCLSGA
jgi:hypothetical protein